MVTATVYCLNFPLKWLLIISYSLLCIWGLFKAMTASSPWQRRLCFLLPFSMRIMLTLLRISKLGGGNPTSLTHVFLQVSVSSTPASSATTAVAVYCCCSVSSITRPYRPANSAHTINSSPGLILLLRMHSATNHFPNPLDV
uniref:Uncharacterized protein n=1 Tax=Anopheles melas TaxID=34690 RepID=A0A182TWI7_9DIPT